MNNQQEAESSMFFHYGNRYMSMATKEGIKMFELNTVDYIIKHIYDIPQYRSAYIVERYLESHNLFIVARDDPKVLLRHSLKKRESRQKIFFEDPILAVKLCYQRVVVCFENHLTVFNLNVMTVPMQQKLCSPPNPNGVCAITNKFDKRLFAYPLSSDLVIYNLDTNKEAVRIPKAHNSPLVAMTFNDEGDKIAIADETGTDLRVFSTIDGTLLHEFHRGLIHAAIQSMDYSLGYLCCSSNRGTIHIFKCGETSVETDNQEDSSWYNALKGVLTKPYDIVAAATSTALETGSYKRCFAKITCVASENKTVRRIVGLTNANGKRRVLVASCDKDSIISSYKIPPEGGECQLKRNHGLDIFFKP